MKIMAKDLVRTRRYVKKFIMMRANIQAVSLKVQVSDHCIKKDYKCSNSNKTSLYDLLYLHGWKGFFF